MIAVDVLESDFATAENEKKMVIAQPLTSGLTKRAATVLNVKAVVVFLS